MVDFTKPAVADRKPADKKPEPIAKVRIGSVQSAIWLNEGQQSGKKYLAATFQRSYKDQSGDWKNTDSFGSGALLELAKCADLTHSRMLKLYSEMPKEQQDQITDADIPF